MGYLDYRKSNPIYSPGLSSYNGNTTEGANGADGTSLYYADRTLSKGNNKEIFNQRIQNELSLDGSQTKIVYKKGDVIIDDACNVYIIELSDNKLIIGDRIGNIYHTEEKQFSIDDNKKFHVLNEDFIFIGNTTEMKDGNAVSDDIKYIQQANTITGEVTLWEIKNE